MIQEYLAYRQVLINITSNCTLVCGRDAEDQLEKLFPYICVMHTSIGQLVGHLGSDVCAMGT